MRILHLISSGGLYGAEAMILQMLGPAGAASGLHSEVALFSLPVNPEPPLYAAAVAGGSKAYLVACRGQLDLGVPARLRALLKASRAELVHAHGYKADVYARLAFRGAGRPALVSTCHTWYDNDLALRLYGALDRWALRGFDEVVAVSGEVRDRLLRAGVPQGRIHQIRNGIEVERSDAVEAVPGTAAANLGPDSVDRRLRVGLVGRLAPEKGVDVFLEAAALLLSESTLPVEFLVAGDGPDHAALEALSRRLALGDRVRLLGRQSDMRSFYRSIDLLVSASRQEGLPMALLEGMAARKAVVATRVGEVPDVVLADETGLLVSPEDPPALAAAMRKLLEDPGLRERFAAAGLERVQQSFSAVCMAASYREVYQAALSRRPAPLTKAAGAAGHLP